MLYLYEKDTLFKLSYRYIEQKREKKYIPVLLLRNTVTEDSKNISF